MGIDGGGTKTLGILYNPATNQVWAAQSGGSNPRALGVERAAEALDHIVNELVAQSAAHPSAIRSTVIGLSATDNPQDRDVIFRAAKTLSSLQSLYGTNDVPLAWAAGTYCQPGVAIIAGTGSNTFGVSESGNVWRTGGHDYILGDEGSGFWIGLSAMKKALRFRDGRGRATELAGRLMRFYGIGRIDELLNLVLVQGSSIGKAEVAAFAVEVSEAAKNGDQVAIDIFARAARDLAEQVNTVIHKLKLEGEFPVGMIGSVWRAGALIRQPFEASVSQVARHARFVIPDIPPAAGAVLLAATAANKFGAIDLKEFQRKTESFLTVPPHR